MSQKFETMLSELNIEYTGQMLDSFQQYYEMLTEWNKVMNLTGITEYEEVVSKHFIDSLSIVKALDMNQISKIIDIGTGAGFPGIPIKIVYPHIEVSLLDSLNKRIRYLDAVIDRLQLKHIVTLHGRAEDYAKQKAYREQYKLSVSRAVANLSALSEYCLPFTAIGGYFIAYKSGEADEEIQKSETAIRKLGGKKEQILKFKLPETDINRTLVKIKKISPTKKQYPRKAGMPTKEPL